MFAEYQRYHNGKVQRKDFDSLPVPIVDFPSLRRSSLHGEYGYRKDT
jgi:hypothetical protein